MKEIIKKKSGNPFWKKMDYDIPGVTPFGRKLWVSRVVPYFINHKGTRRWSRGTYVLMRFLVKPANNKTNMRTKRKQKI